MKLNLLVLRVADLNKARNFYERVGLAFVEERHGAGPLHLSANLEGAVLELYPSLESNSTTSETRFGFAVDNVALTANEATSAGGSVLSAPRDSSWGRRAVIADPDGHKIELTQILAGK